jgi:class 3 adenylate cyclase
VPDAVKAAARCLTPPVPRSYIPARVCALAKADEVVTTGTVRDLVIGSLLAFEPRGGHELQGVPGDWTVLSATDPARPASGPRYSSVTASK